VTRDTMDGETQRLWAERTLRAVNRAFPGWEGQRARRTLCDRLVPHAVTCLDEADRQGIKVIDVHHLRRDLGVHLENRSLFNEAESLFRRALAGFEDLCGADSVDAARMNHLVGRIFRVVERREEAEQYFRRALAIFDKVLGPDHVETANTLNSLGVLLSSTDRRQAEAEGFLLRALAIFEKSGEPEPTRLANTLGCLANLRNRQARDFEAETLLHKAIAIRESAAGVESPDLYFNLLSLSNVVRDLGRLNEAEPLLIRALGIAENGLTLTATRSGLSIKNLVICE
jgi:tetratricopeptide (TPR) repeat protein